jgi:hypothetical protein
MLSARGELIAPGELGAVEAAARGEFPFGFRRQVLARPFGVSERVRIGDMDDGMAVQPVDVALWPVRMPPIRALEITPPLAEISQIDRMIWRRENQRAGIEHMRQRAGILFWIGRNFRKCFMPGGADEFLELPIGHRRAIDPEAVDRDAMDRRLFRVMPIGSHAERAAGDENHVRLWRCRLLQPFG